MPTVTLVNNTGAKWGIALDELGVNLEEIKCTVAPEFIEKLPDKQNITRSRAYGPMMLAVALSGETLGSTGIMAAVLGTAFVCVNSTAYFGAPATGLYFQGGSVTSNRGQWQKFDATLEADAGVA